jgi:hypothetical protein
MKKIVLTTALSIAVAGSCLAQGFWSFDNSANFTGTSPNSFAIALGSAGHIAAGEGSAGAFVGSGSAPNYDVGYLYLAGTSFSGQSLTPQQFIADGATFANSFNNATANNALFAATTGDVADGAGFFQGGSSHITDAADGSLYTIQLIAWYDPTGTTSYLTSFADNFNTGSSTLNTIRMAAGLDVTVADASGFNGFLLTAPVPEPSTMALAGLGGLAALMFRRKK